MKLMLILENVRKCRICSQIRNKKIALGLAKVKIKVTLTFQLAPENIYMWKAS